MALRRTAADKRVFPTLLLLVGAFLILGVAHIWIAWSDAKALLISLQRGTAEDIAAQIHEYLAMVQKELGSIRQTQYFQQSSFGFEYLRLQRLLPEISEITRIDGQGVPIFTLSPRIYHGSRIDYLHDPRFTEAMERGSFVGPPYFARGDVPYVSITVAHAGSGSHVTVAELEFKRVWQIIDRIKIGGTGYAYVIDNAGRLIAYKDKALVLGKADLSTLPQVLAISSPGAPWRPGEGKTFDNSPSGAAVFSVYADVPRLAWKVIVELPARQAEAPLWRAVLYVAGLMGLGLIAMSLASLAAVRRISGREYGVKDN